jgi:LmbE family N-acetylglucosaminyl deacetylase
MQPKRVLAFGAHPDDVEWGMAGTLLKMRQAGCEVFIADLTMGDAAATGTPMERFVEGQNAAALLGAKRLTLNLGDKKLQCDSATAAVILDVIRSVNPELIYAPYWDDRHPDHAVTGKLLKPYASAFYILRDSVEPTHMVDVSEEVEEKKNILWQHSSQLRSYWEPNFFRRHEKWGRIIGAKAAEAFIVNDQLDFLKEELPELL